MMTITTHNASAYLYKRGVLSEDANAVSRPLAGGVSNRVIQVETDSECYVLKQPLENLAVEDDWPADVARVHNEAAATRAYRRFCADLPHTHTPQVLDESFDDHAVVFSCVSSAEMWKRDLLDGAVDTRVSRACGEALGTVHAAAPQARGVRETFDDNTPFIQLRVDPYHRTTARRHPDIADTIHDEIERLVRTERTLVHGDYSPKNVLLTRTDPPEIWILDFEVAHWGDPAFDTAFMLNHLFIKSVYNRDQQRTYFDAVDSFWTAYCEAVPWDIERETVRELAILMLARVDGKSPVEYIDSEATAETLRSVAKHALRSEISSIAEFRTTVENETDTR